MATMFLLAAASSATRAGQVRVDVGPDSTMSFSPQNISLNQGDQVVWIWRSGSHSVTQGSDCSSAGALFNTSERSDYSFSWKSDRTGTIPYFCIPHCLDGMTGSITISAQSVPVSDFRITEISRSNQHTNDYIEITNLGDAPGNLGRYRIAIATNNDQVLRLHDIFVPAGGSITIHTGVRGTDSQTDSYLEAISLLALGSVALLAPNLLNSNINNVSMFLDYVEWGAGGRPNELTAQSALFWSSGEFLPMPEEGHSLEFCGNQGDHGFVFWRETATPTPGTHVLCGTPVEASTWGRVKALRR